MIGGAIGAGVATTFTYAMGQAWLRVCQQVHAGKLSGLDGALDNDQLRDAFLSEFKKRLGRKDIDAVRKATTG